MRVRMLTTHETTATHPELGALSLIFGAGTTQHFDDATAASLISAKKAEAHPEDSQRVRMTRTVTELDLAERINELRQRDGLPGRVAPAPGTEGDRYRKGDLVHFPNETANALLDANLTGGAAASLEPDPDYNPIAATLASVTDAAIARAREQREAEQRRATVKAHAAAVVARAPKSSPAPSSPAPSSPAPAAPPVASTSNASSEG
jgi:hypothetical protein